MNANDDREISKCQSRVKDEQNSLQFYSYIESYGEFGEDYGVIYMFYSLCVSTTAISTTSVQYRE